MESEDGSIFEINDFTNVTPWERDCSCWILQAIPSFISDIEKIFHQWGLVHSDPTAPDTTAPPPSAQRQHRKSERVTYAGRTFVVTLEVGGAGRGGAKKSEERWPQAMCDLADNSADFPPKTHCISRWYGVRQFVLIVPDEQTNPLHSQAQANLMLSSVSVAIANTGCTTPVFIQILDKWRQMYVGVCEGGGLRTTFDMVYLRYTPPQYNHLAGLTELFKAKLMCPQAKLAPVEIAVRLTYVLKHWSLDDWPVEPLGDVEKEVGPKYLMTLPVGAISDPVEELHLSAVWPKLTEELIVDTTSHSDLNPTHAPLWTVTLRLTKKPSCLLAEHLLNFLKLCYREEPVSQLLGSSTASESGVGYSHALDRLTGGPSATLSSPLFSSVVYSAHQGAWKGVGPSGEEPLQEQDMDTVMKHLFPDAYESDGASASTGAGAGAGVRGEGDEGQERSLRSAPHGSLTNLLARALCIVNNEHGLRAFCHVWSEVVKELRYRWENGIVIPNLPEGPPDMTCCLLHQKLQMLNCCIKHKLAHENKLNTHSGDFMSPNIHSQSTQTPTISTQPVGSISSAGTSELQLESEFLTPASSFTVQHKPGEVSLTSLGASDSDDEFYEALESQEDGSEDALQIRVLETGQSGQATGSTGLTASADTDSHTPTNEVTAVHVGQSDEESDSKLEEPHTEKSEPTPDFIDISSSSGGRGDAAMTTERVGALKPCGDLMLLATGEPLCIPVTQEPPPVTEDMVREQERVLARLGTSEEAAILRAKMQSSSLISDMQAFKAANPGALLEDFVRWYSPRDWIEEPTYPSPGEPSRQADPQISEAEAQRDEERGVEEGPSPKTDATDSIPEPTDSIPEPEGDRRQGGSETAAEHGIGDQIPSGLEHSPNMEETASQPAAESDSEAKVVETVPSNQSDSLNPDSNQSNDKVDGEREKSKFSVKGGDGDGEGWGAEWEDEEWDLVAGEEAEGEEGEGVEVEGEGVTEAHAVPEVPKRYAKGHLSQRMLQPDNIWVETWQSATPLPAYKQKRLFDDTREAEKVLHYLSGLRLSDVSLSLIATLLHSALVALQKKQRARPVATVDSLLQDATAMLATVQQPTLDALPKYQECIALLSQAEHLLAAAHSLRTKLAQGLELRGVALEGKTAAEGVATTRELEASVEMLLEGPELVLGDPGRSHTGTALQGLLAAQVATGDLEVREKNKVEMSISDFPPASGREFILRSTVPRPAPYSHPSPQRLFIVLRHGEFRLAGAFSDDTNLV